MEDDKVILLSYEEAIEKAAKLLRRARRHPEFAKIMAGVAAYIRELYNLPYDMQIAEDIMQEAQR